MSQYLQSVSVCLSLQFSNALAQPLHLLIIDSLFSALFAATRHHNHILMYVEQKQDSKNEYVTVAASLKQR